MTIKENIIRSKDELKKLKTHTELREWAINQGYDNRSAFSNFKKGLKAIDIDYEAIRDGISSEKRKDLLNDISYEVTLYSDAKASAGKFGITDIEGNVLWYGIFFDNENASEQSSAELEAAKKAVWLANKVKEAINEKSIRLNLIVDAQWLLYQTHSKQKGYALKRLADKYSIDLNTEWIRGTENPADEWTTAKGFKKWSENDLSKLAVKIEKKAEPPSENNQLAVAKAKAIAIKLKLLENNGLQGNVIEPQKQVKANQKRAIADVLQLDKFKAIPKHTAGIVFNQFKNKIEVEPGVDYPENGLVDNTLEGKAFDLDLVDWPDWNVYKLTDYGESFMLAVKSRLQSLKTVKSGGDLFPETANVPEYSKKEGAKARAKAISTKLKLSA